MTIRLCSPATLYPTRFVLDDPDRKFQLGIEKNSPNSLTPDQRIARHRDFLDANWRRIASFTYGEFLGKGKGIVAVPEADFIDAHSPAYAPIHFRYFPDSEALILMPDYEGSKEQGWVRSYDPETKVIVMVIRYDSGVSSYLIGSKPIPPEAYRLEKAKGN